MTQPHQRNRHPKYRKKYKVHNWRSYERSLINRGDLTRKVKILFLTIVMLIHELRSKLGLVFHLLFLRYLSMVKYEQSTETFTTSYTAI